MNRRDFAKTMLVGTPSLFGLYSCRESNSNANSAAQTDSRQGRTRTGSVVNGVQFGIQPFCYHDLVMNRDNRPELLRRIVMNGFNLVELHATWCEPRFNAEGVSAIEAR